MRTKMTAFAAFTWWLGVLLAMSIVPLATGAESYIADTSNVRAQFETMNFKELDDIFRKYASLCEEDVLWENALLDAFNVFNVPNADYKQILDEWVRITPNDWVPLMARATYYDGLGWSARGAKFAKDTTSKQFKEMTKYVELAVQDIKEATKVKSKSFYPYYLMMKINRSAGNQRTGELLVKKALELAPDSYLVRRQHLQLLLPRWGGSHEEMEKFIQDSVSHINKNKNIQTLQGLVSWDKALTYRREKRYDMAIDLFVKSLSHGETWVTLYDLADTYYRSKQYDLGLQTIDKAIAQLPNLPDRYILSAPNLQDAYQLRKYLLEKRNKHKRSG